MVSYRGEGREGSIRILCWCPVCRVGMNAWAVLWGSRTQPLDDYGMLILVSGEEGIENRQRERKGYKKG